MPFDDLDLEFEDEEEAKKKKKEAVDVDVDLDFAVPEGARPRPAPPKPQAQAPGTAPSISRPTRPAEVRNIQDARPPQPQAKRPPGAPPAPGTQPRVAGTSALKEEVGSDYDSQQVIELRAEMQRIQLESEVRVQVAEFKAEFLSEMLSDMKLASHQIEQLLVRINAKHPDMKNEVLMIKKILADFTAKKRK